MPANSLPLLLEVRNVSVEFATHEGAVRAVTSVDLDVAPGETLAIVGESGSGKSQMLLSLLGLTARNGRVNGSARFKGEELVGASAKRLNQIRGAEIGFVFQDPMTSLNPYLTIGRQLTEPLTVQRRVHRAAARAQAIEMLHAVHITEPERRMQQYPHQFSGGMRQRVAIAMALICRPELLIADEPTTALDVTVQAQVLALLREIRERLGTAVILVTHDLGVIAEVADRVHVMYAGRIVETGPVDEIFYNCRHPYTQALERSIPQLSDNRLERLVAIAGSPPSPLQLPPGCAFHPRCPYRLDVCDKSVPPLETVEEGHRKACFYEGALDRVAQAEPEPGMIDTMAGALAPQPPMGTQPILSVRDLRVYFEIRAADGWLSKSQTLRAVDGVSFDLLPGETLGVVGESGCGKSTMARAVLGLVPVTGGEVIFAGKNLARLDAGAMRAERQHLQIIFQDPLASLDPRMTLGQIIGEPLRSFFPRMSASERQAKVAEAMSHVGLLPEQINRYPHEFSGGQAQRIGIARALILRPEVVVCDEPVSALDVSIKAQILNLLSDLQARFGLSLLFIAHDLASVRHASRRVMVLYLGKVMELAPWQEIYRTPLHPYTQALIAAIPPADPRRARSNPAKPLGGEVPSPIAPPSGCVFRTRCAYAIERCAAEVPALRRVGESLVACHLAEQIQATRPEA